jgi:pilus assembly protein CpaB
MNPRRILIALSLAFLVSALCTWFVSRKLRAPVAFEKTRDVSYAAPSRDMQAGEVLKPDNTELVLWPASAPLDGASSQIQDVLGRQALFPFAKGQPFLDHGLSTADAGTGLAARIPDGFRAVALRSDEVVGVAGYIVPGSHLDVLVTYRPDSAPEALTAVVLQDALVLAAGRLTGADAQGKLPDVALVTLLLTLEQAQRAVLASNQGAIHFVLRNGGDAGVSAGTPVLLSQLSGRPVAVARPSLRPAIQAAVAVPKPHVIETVLGGVAP